MSQFLRETLSIPDLRFTFVTIRRNELNEFSLGSDVYRNFCFYKVSRTFSKNR